MKKLISLLLAVMMLASMASFAAAEEEKTLVFINQAAWKDQMQVLCDRYYEETGVKVVLENYSFNDMINTIEVKISTGSTDYDILSVDVPLVSSYARRGMLADLSPYFTEEDRAKLVTAAVEASTYEGKLYASPLANSSQVLYYNTKLLEDAGIDLAELEAYSTDNRITYERLVEIAEQALKVLDPDGTQGMIGFDFQQVDRVYQMNQLPNSMGGVQVSEDGYSLDGVLNTEPWKKALTWYQEQVKKGDAIFPRLDIDKELEELYAISESMKKDKEPENIPLDLKPAIEFEDFDKIDFRVGVIEKAEKHPKADKLLVFRIKMGTEHRQVISGVAKDFTPEEMVGKKVIVVANLKPRQLRGMESKGMLLFADNGDRCEIVTTSAPDGESVG